LNSLFDVAHHHWGFAALDDTGNTGRERLIFLDGLGDLGGNKPHAKACRMAREARMMLRSSFPDREHDEPAMRSTEG